MTQDARFFSAVDYFSEHNDGDLTLEGVLSEMDGFVSRQGVCYSTEEIKEQIAEIEANVKDIKMTIDKYRLSGEKNEAIYTPDRLTLHNAIIEEFVINKIKPSMMSEQPKVFIMLGGRAGSGKSSGFRGVAYNEDFIVLDSDEIKARLPEYKGWNAEEVHEESGDILEKCLQAARELKLNVVIETTMGTTGSALRRIREFKQDGYRVEAHYMFLPMQKAGRRAMERFLNGAPQGRYIPIEILQKMDKTEYNFDIIKPFVDGWSFYSNEYSDTTGKPELIAQYGSIYLQEKYRQAYEENSSKWSAMSANLQKMKNTVKSLKTTPEPSQEIPSNDIRYMPVKKEGYGK